MDFGVLDVHDSRLEDALFVIKKYERYAVHDKLSESEWHEVKNAVSQYYEEFMKEKIESLNKRTSEIEKLRLTAVSDFRKAEEARNEAERILRQAQETANKMIADAKNGDLVRYAVRNANLEYQAIVGKASHEASQIIYQAKEEAKSISLRFGHDVNDASKDTRTVFLYRFCRDLSPAQWNSLVDIIKRMKEQKRAEP